MKRAGYSWNKRKCHKVGGLVPLLALLFGLILLPAGAGRGQGDEEDILHGLEMNLEPISPNEMLPDTMERGLQRRAIPELPPFRPRQTQLPFYRLNRMGAIQDVELAPIPIARDPSTFRTVEINEPPMGLHPRIFRPGLLEIYPWFGLAQSFDSNVNLTADDPIADFYVTPRAGLELQLGTPDSIYLDGYDTILALRGKYEAWADLYYENPDLSAFNQMVELTARIGRSSAIWRPFFGYSDQTGSNLLMAELVNRTQRLRTQGGVTGEYSFTERLGANQLFSFYSLDHTDPVYINYAMGQTRQELTYHLLAHMHATAWAAYRYTRPGVGSSASEYQMGIGFYGKPDPRLYTEVRLGWDVMSMEGTVPNRWNMSGVRFNGYTTFEWSERLRLTLRYDREYVFNEITENDNYVSTLLQTRWEFFLGGNWYVTPYAGFSLQEFETSHNLAVQWRPELEVAYSLPDLYPGDSRIFAKVAYMTSYYLTGNGEPVENWRFSVGLNWKF